MVDVNGNALEPGCFVDGWGGQYAIAEMVQLAQCLGYEPQQGDLAARHLAAMGPGGAPGLSDEEYESLGWEADRAQNWLNAVTEEGYAWEWRDGEFFLLGDDEDADPAT